MILKSQKSIDEYYLKVYHCDIKISFESYALFIYAWKEMFAIEIITVRGENYSQLKSHFSDRKPTHNSSATKNMYEFVPNLHYTNDSALP